MRFPIVRLDGVPSLEPYILAARQPSASLRARLDFAAMLVEREAYYLAIYAAHGAQAGIQPAEHDLRWVPHPATASTRRRLALLASGRWSEEQAQSSLDVFGLKTWCLERLTESIARRPASLAAMLVATRFALELRRFGEAATHGQKVLDLESGNRAALAYRYDAIVLAPAADWRTPAVMAREERRMRRAFGSNWIGEAARAQEAHHVMLRRHAWRLRRRDEGAAFLRFLTGEREFCESERRRVAATVDPGRVPRPLRSLLPAALTYGVGDDGCRTQFLNRMGPGERRDLITTVSEHAAAIDAWLGTHTPPYGPEMSVYYWLRTAVDELESRS